MHFNYYHSNESKHVNKLKTLLRRYHVAKCTSDDDASIESSAESICADTSDSDDERTSSPSIASSEISEESSGLFSTTQNVSPFPDLCVEFEPSMCNEIEVMINADNKDILRAKLDDTITSYDYARNSMYYECLNVMREIEENANKKFLRRVYDNGTLQEYDSVILCKNIEKPEYSFCLTCTNKYLKT